MTKNFLAALAVCVALAPAAAADPFKVKVDETVTLKLGQAADSVVVGNAAVADVSVHDARTLLVTGKSFGATNLTVLDRAGNTIYSSRLVVGGEDDASLTIVRSGATYSYSCTDKCRATAMVGDAPGHFSDVMSAVTAKSQTAKGN